MATTEKAKKAAKPKKGNKGKKKGKGNTSMGFFPKLMLTLLLLSMVTIAALLVIGNFKTDKTDNHDTELTTIKKDEIQVNKEDPKTENLQKTEIRKTTPKDEPNKEPAKTEVKAENKSGEKKQETMSQEKKTLKGSWLSSEQGASLTLDEYGYRIDFFGVDASKPMTGNYTIEKNLIVFTSDDKDCKGSGTYRITFYKDDFSLIAKDDECTKRRNILEADWEWIEI